MGISRTLGPRLKAVVNEHCHRRQIPAYDMTGGVIQFFTDHSGRQPSNEPDEKKRGMRKKVVALTIQPKRLQQIRARRMAVNKFDAALAATGEKDEFSYMNLKGVIQEVMNAESLYRDRQFPVVDITDQSVDVTATAVLGKLGLQRPFT